MQAIKIALDDKFVNDVVLAEDLTGDIIITGYYSNRLRGGADGAYIIRVDFDDKNTVKKLNTTYQNFSGIQEKIENLNTSVKNNEKAVNNLHNKNSELENVGSDIQGIQKQFEVIKNLSDSIKALKVKVYLLMLISIIILLVTLLNKPTGVSAIT